MPRSETRSRHATCLRYHADMDDFERKWKMMRDYLFAEATGTEPRPFSSGRTLFGIKSEAEQKMERFAREIEEEQLRKLREDAARDAKGQAEETEAKAGAGTQEHVL